MQGYAIVTNNPKIAVAFTQQKCIFATTVSAGWGQRASALLTILTKGPRTGKLHLNTRLPCHRGRMREYGGSQACT